MELDLRGRFQGLAAELDALSSTRGALDALRGEGHNNVEALVDSFRTVASSTSADSLGHLLPLISKCCSLETQAVSVNLRLHSEGWDALRHVGSVLSAANSIPGHAQLPQHLSSVVLALRSGVFTRLIDPESLTGGVDIFELFLNASFTGMSSFTDCLCTLANQAVSSAIDAAQGPDSDVLGVVVSWMEALVGLGSSVVNASKESPPELRSGMVLTRVWKEIVRLLHAVPADSRAALSNSASSAFNAAWHQVQVRCQQFYPHSQLHMASYSSHEIFQSHRVQIAHLHMLLQRLFQARHGFLQLDR